jgi:acetylornithine deacetylase
MGDVAAVAVALLAELVRIDSVNPGLVPGAAGDAGASSAAALEEVRALLAPEWAATADLLAHRDGWRLDDAGPAAGLARRLGDELGTGPTFDAPYWMEAPLWQRLCPTVVCGPSGGGLHAADEWVDLRQVRALASALTGILRGWRPGAD